MFSKHELCLIGHTWHCSNCMQQVHDKSARLKQWLAAPCEPDSQRLRTLDMGKSKPASVAANAEVVIGTKVAHATHSLAAFKGLYFCRKCGYYGSARAQKLALACAGRAAPNADNRLRALLHGKLPPGLTAWPNEQPKGTRPAVRL